MPYRPLSPATARRWTKPLAVLALVFGIMTVFSGGTVLFGSAEAQTQAGDYVGFVVWFNFLAGGAYIATAVGVWFQKSWAAHFAIFVAIATALIAVAFAIVVIGGTPFEMRTIGALALRFTFWVIVAWIYKQTLRAP